MIFETKNFNFKEKDKTIIIAEVGVNHNGDKEIAKKMALVAKECGVDIVKFQAFDSSKEISVIADKASYQKKEKSLNKSINQLELCKSLELSYDSLKEIKDYCNLLQIPFLCTAFEENSLNFLVDELKVKSLKIPSPEITNIPFLEKIGRKKIGVILSTGGSNISEVGEAVGTLLDSGCPELVLMHCVSQYPAPFDEINIRAIRTMKKAFNLPVGFSDHSIGIIAPIVASVIGAVVIEKHFTLDRKMEGPDHKASIEPFELKLLVDNVKIANKCLGNNIKQASKCEYENIPLIRKSLVASLDLKKGTTICREMVDIKRPEGGIEPRDFEKIIGLRLNKDIKADNFIKWEDFHE